MGKIFAFLMTTLDGYVEGPGGEFDFWVLDDEFARFSAEQLDEAGTLVFGRVTYEGMAAYWPAPEAARADPETAARMNALPKVVVSRSLAAAGWANTRIVREAGELAGLRREPGGDVAILGSSSLTSSLLGMGLVDELRILLNPVVLGAGKPVLAGAEARLRLLDVRRFASGNVLLRYAP